MKQFERTLWIFLIWLAVTGSALGELALSPLRQVITAQSPRAEYQISNPSDRIIEGRVSWIDLVATEAGYETAGTDIRDELSAAPFLRVRPARFSLEPGGRATISVELRDIKTVPKGERRSHLLIEIGAARTPLRKAGGGLELDIGLGVSTPVILRGGESDAGAIFKQTRLLRDEDGFLELETVLAPTGGHSAFGALTAVMRPQATDNNGVGNLVVKPAARDALARLDNVAVFPDARLRRFNLPLGVSQLPAGIMDLTFAGAEEYDGRLFATKSFEIVGPE